MKNSENENLGDEGFNDENNAVTEKLQLEKAKKNLVYVSLMSVLMLFGGLISAYIVSMGDSFWLKVPLPTAFWISTAIIILSSVTFILSLRAARRDQAVMQKAMMTLTFVLGLGFVFFQFKGYKQLVENGVYAVSNHIVVTDGRYGDYFEVKYKGEYIEVNGNDFLLGGKKMTPPQLKAYQKFMSQFLEYNQKDDFMVEDYGKDFLLMFKHEPMFVQDKHLMKADSTPMESLDNTRLQYLAMNVRDGRGDFFVRGEMGKDFHIYYKGQELEYKDRELHLNGRILSNYLQLKSLESPDTASSYLYILTFLHLLHIIVTLLVLLRPLIHSFTGKINSQNNIGLVTAGIFWHFLGLLWLGLLLFLLFIH